MSRKGELPYVFAKTQCIIVDSDETKGGRVLITDGTPLTALSEVRRRLGPNGAGFQVCRLTQADFEAALAERYSRAGEGGINHVAGVVADIGQEVDLSRLMQELPAVEDLLETQDDAPIIRMINALLTQALREGVSDVHIEPYERHSSVRFRCDGVLREVAQPHRGLHAAMVSRLKIMANLDIAEKRVPQDGRIGLRIAGRQLDVRVSTLPANHGERLVLRLLEKGASQRSLDHLGMATDMQARFANLLAQPHGIVLVTGPTGSGKSTTLYAALQTLDRYLLNILTVEDPIEYELPGIGQIAVNAKVDLTFARALRAILRQDPDVIMIGEIRDLETAQIAVQASLTGHLVLATLHTNDAASAVTRLVDMGIEPFLLASTLRGVLAQRLVRCLCPDCRCAHPLDERTANDERRFVEDAVDALGGEGRQRWRAPGCTECGGSGYRGRTGIYELIEIDATGAALIHDGAHESKLRAHARTIGSRSLRQDGLRHLDTGVTSLEELVRATRE